MKHNIRVTFGTIGKQECSFTVNERGVQFNSLKCFCKRLALDKLHALVVCQIPQENFDQSHKMFYGKLKKKKKQMQQHIFKRAFKMAHVNSVSTLHKK